MARHGFATACGRLDVLGRDHDDDVVTAIIVMGRLQHTNEILPKIETAINDLNNNGSLPDGVKLVPFYDRGTLVGVTTHTVIHNLVFGLDEVGNMLAKELSQLIHKISQGKSKIRMQASVNAERDHEMSASLIAIFTSNHSLYDKLTTIKKDPNGEVARIIEFMLGQPKILQTDLTFGRRVFEAFKTNYGHAGPKNHPRKLLR